MTLTAQGLKMEVIDSTYSNKKPLGTLVEQTPAAGAKAKSGRVVYVIQNARFKRPVEPGDQLVMEAELIRSSRGMWKFRTRGLVDGQLAVEAELMCAIRGGVVSQKAES